MQIAIFGAGGVGGYFGARLIAAGESVSLIARGEHLRSLREDGLVVESPVGGLVVPDVHATDDPREVGLVELVIVAVKSWQLAEAIAAMDPMVGSGAVVLPLLNGVEAATQLSDALGPDRVLKGLTRIISYVEAPGRIRHVGVEPYIALGESDNRRSDRTQRILAMLQRAGIRADIPRDIDVALWEKFLAVVPLGGVGAVTRAPVGAVRTVPETREMLCRAMAEVHAVAHARGIGLRETIVDDTLAFADTLPASGTASLQRDIASGRRSELEAWNGAVVRLGGEVRVSTPIHDFIYRSLLPLELRARGELAFVE
jgi:2-dehydropantoate 2-reductase